MIEMEVVGIALEPNSHRPLVWLKDRDQKVFLPIAIGNFEATAIYMELYNEPPPRPITYDLLRSILEGLNAETTQIVITDLKDDTFFAEITLISASGQIKVDSRPSDAIALALRVGAPVYVSEEVVREAGLDVEEQPDLDLEMLEESMQNMGGEEPISELDQGSPDGDSIQDRVINLKEKLKDAVAHEQYEEAARLRDEIGRLEHHEK